MNWVREIWRRVKFLRHRSQAEEDLAEEMRLHLDLRAEETGRDESRRRFGNELLLRETSREAWGWRWLDSLSQDLRYGARALAAHPGFTITAVLSLALGIGANTAIFSIVNAVMLRALPVEDPQRLVQLRSGRNGSFTNPIWEQVRDHQQAFAGALAYGDGRFDLASGGESRFAQGLWVSGDFFRVLGIAPLRGRLLTAEDDQHGGGKSGPVAVISYAFWQSYFGGDAAVLGKTITLDRHPFEIVGVTPPYFTGLDVDKGFDVSIPIGCEPILHTDLSALDHRSWWWLRILARLKPGDSIPQAEARIQALQGEVRRATMPTTWEEEDRKNFLKDAFQLRPTATGFSSTRDRYRQGLFTLMAVVGLVLLIACANIANLLLARAAARQREISIRMAIGAGRRRVIRQLLTESLLLSGMGALGGFIFSLWGSRLLVRLFSTALDPLDVDVSPDLMVLAFTSGVALLTGILFGLAPAFRATSVAPNHVLKENARGSIAGGSRFRLGKMLVATQVALSLVLLVGAGLFLNSLRNLLGTSTGFDRRNVTLVRVNTLEKVPKERRVELFRTILERLRTVPGVTSAASSLITPVSHRGWNQFVVPEGYAAQSREDTLTWFNRVSPGYFRTMATPLRAGRDFDSRDTMSSTKVIIINEAAARHYFGGVNAIGKNVGMDLDGKKGGKEFFQVIGIVADTKYIDLREETKLSAYLVTTQEEEPRGETNFILRSAVPGSTLTGAVRAAIAEIDSGLALEFRDFETQVNDSLVQERTVALLSSFFGVLAVMLAMIGLYGVTSYAVLRRQGEIGIRMALGASQGSVVWLVLRDVTLILAAGTVLGVAASLAAGRLITAMLFGVKPADPATLGICAAVLALATAIAGFVPAHRASRLDPTSALRDE
jgi:predicted permease